MKRLFYRSAIGLFCAAIWTIAALSDADAQQPLTQPPEPAPNPATGANLVDFIFKKSPYEFWLTILIITFGIGVLAIFIYAVRNIPDKRPEDISRTLIVITVITASLLLITAGYSNEQIAPAFGLFGTIVGYMLGRMSHGTGQSDPKGSNGDIASNHTTAGGTSSPAAPASGAGSSSA
jgi:hypothetical protein